jgi:hypothetical protein
MSKLNLNTRHELSGFKRNTKQLPFQEKVKLLKLCIEETQRYQLLTTNQYLKHLILYISILDDLTDRVEGGL